MLLLLFIVVVHALFERRLDRVLHGRHARLVECAQHKLGVHVLVRIHLGEGVEADDGRHEVALERRGGRIGKEEFVGHKHSHHVVVRRVQQHARVLAELLFNFRLVCFSNLDLFRVEQHVLVGGGLGRRRAEKRETTRTR